MSMPASKPTTAFADAARNGRVPFKVADLSLADFGRREIRLAEQEMTIELTDGAKELLAERGFDPVLGARPLRRAVQRDIEDAISRMVAFVPVQSKQPMPNMLHDIAFLDLVGNTPFDPDLFVDAVHTSYAGTRIRGWAAFNLLVPLVEKKLAAN